GVGRAGGGGVRRHPPFPAADMRLPQVSMRIGALAPSSVCPQLPPAAPLMKSQQRGLQRGRRGAGRRRGWLSRGGGRRSRGGGGGSWGGGWRSRGGGCGGVGGGG